MHSFEFEENFIVLALDCDVLQTKAMLKRYLKSALEEAQIYMVLQGSIG